MSMKDFLYLLKKKNCLLKRKKLKIFDLKTKTNKYALILVLMMSLLLVEVSATQYQNQSTATIHANRINGSNRRAQKITTNITTTTTSTATSITSNTKIVTKTESKRKNIRKQSNKENSLPKKALGKEKLKVTSTRKSRKDLAKRMRADAQQQYHDHESQRQNQHQRYRHYSTPAEAAYLVERANDDNANANSNAHNNEQPQQNQANYGSWRIKARRAQQASSVKHDANASSSTAVAETTILPATQPPPAPPTATDYHVYERLPRRSATMTPIRGEYHDQLQRPPRLTSRRPSLLVRRQYLETPINVTDDFEQQPKPFHFPYDGQMPAAFKKAQQPPERVELNNIQDILQQLQLNGAAASVAPIALRTPLSPQPPQFYMLPTGLHFAGSFKNFKSSGIANFFRGKRNKKQLQLSLPLQFPPMTTIPKPLPLQYYNQGYHQQHGFLPPQQPFQQRIAMDQIYAFKPRSPNEINLLAMQQQLNAKRVKSKNKQTLAPINNINPQYYGLNNGSNNLLLPQNNQRPNDNFVPFYPPQWLVMNATQKPKLKRIPFKVNLDIFPVLPPTKAPAAGAALPLRNPFLDYNPYQYQPQQQQFQHDTNILRLQQQQHQQQQHQHQRQKQKQQQQQVSSSNSQNIYTDSIPKYTQQYSVQQQQSHEPFQRQPLNPQQNSFTPIDFDCIDEPSNENSSPNSNSNQIMLHLNVYPKPRITPTAPLPLPLPSTNPFYNNIQRNSASEQSMESSMESRNLAQQTAYANDTMQQYYPKPQSSRRISRSDENYATLIDYEHPIVAAEIPELLPQPAALVSNKLDYTSDIAPHYDHIELRNNFVVNDFDNDPNIEQVSSEARTASLFRYPVEDLIHFQVKDAL